jgi:hypothetical protein
MLRQPPACPCRPGVNVPAGRLGGFGQEAQLPLQVGVQDGAPDPMRLQAAGQPREAARRLAGLGDGGVDEQDVSDGSAPCSAERFLRSACIGNDTVFVYKRLYSFGRCTLNPEPCTR